MAASGMDALAVDIAATSAVLAELPRRVARTVGARGKDVMFGEARRRWGPDRRWSGAAGSRKASNRRVAGARYRVTDNGATVTWTPTGTPWMVAIRGRKAGKPIKPIGAKAVTVAGNPRAWSTTGALPAQGNIVSPLVPAIERRAVDAVRAEWLRALGRIYKAG